jgi:heat shock protein HtpX
MNSLKTFLLFAVLTVLLMAAGQAMTGSYQGALMGLLIAGVMNFFAYFFSDKMVLASYRAQEVSEAEDPRLHAMVSELADRAEMPKPRVYRIPTPTPNAFATGRNPDNAVVAVTDGLRSMLSEQELRGVIAHELGHVHGRDILIMTVAATMAGALAFFSRMAMYRGMFGGFGRRDRGGGAQILIMILFLALASFAAMLVKMAISRTREYRADEFAAKLTGNPLSLANALRKISAGVRRHPLEANPASAHLFIATPFAERNTLARLFATHPPIEERIARLEEAAGGPSRY